MTKATKTKLGERVKIMYRDDQEIIVPVVRLPTKRDPTYHVEITPTIIYMLPESSINTTTNQ